MLNRKQAFYIHFGKRRRLAPEGLFPEKYSEGVNENSPFFISHSQKQEEKIMKKGKLAFISAVAIVCFACGQNVEKEVAEMAKSTETWVKQQPLFATERGCLADCELTTYIEYKDPVENPNFC